MPATERTDEQLVAAVATGDQTAFKELYDRHQYGLRKYAAKWYYESTATVDDLLQDVWLRVNLYAGTYKPEISKVFSWLCNLAQLEMRRILRKDGIRQNSFDHYRDNVESENPQLADLSETGVHQVDREDEAEFQVTVVQAAAMKRGPRDLQIINEVMAGKTYREIGEQFGVNFQRVCQIVRAVKKGAKKLQAA